MRSLAVEGRSPFPIDAASSTCWRGFLAACRDVGEACCGEGAVEGRKGCRRRRGQSTSSSLGEGVHRQRSGESTSTALSSGSSLICLHPYYRQDGGEVSLSRTAPSTAATSPASLRLPKKSPPDPSVFFCSAEAESRKGLKRKGVEDEGVCDCKTRMRRLSRLTSVDGVEWRPAVVLADGRTFEGQWLRSRRHGEGVERSRAGDFKYVGQFRDNMYEGFGRMYWLNGAKFIGHFSKHQKNGWGHEFYSHGESFRGWFTDGRIDGPGTYRFEDGREVHGRWREGQFLGVEEEGGKRGVVMR